MKLVRFGKRVINMDNVCDIAIGTSTAEIYFNVPRGYWADGEGKIEQEYTTLYGADMIALEQWLEANSEDARAPMMDDDSNSDTGDDLPIDTPAIILQRDLM